MKPTSKYAPSECLIDAEAALSSALNQWASYYSEIYAEDLSDMHHFEAALYRDCKVILRKIQAHNANGAHESKK